MTTCDWCGRICHEIHVLRDRNGEVCGHYCSRDHAAGDAYGPRFRPWTRSKPGRVKRGFSIRKERG